MLLLFFTLAFVRLQHLFDVLECVDLLLLQEVGDFLWREELGGFDKGFRGFLCEILAGGDSMELLGGGRTGGLWLVCSWRVVSLLHMLSLLSKVSLISQFFLLLTAQMAWSGRKVSMFIPMVSLLWPRGEVSRWRSLPEWPVVFVVSSRLNSIVRFEERGSISPTSVVIAKILVQASHCIELAVQDVDLSLISPAILTVLHLQMLSFIAQSLVLFLEFCELLLAAFKML